MIVTARVVPLCTMTPRIASRNTLLGILVLIAVSGAALIQRRADASAVGAPALPIAARSSPPAVAIDVPDTIAAVFGEHAGAAMCIAGAESGWRGDAVAHNDDGSRDRGVFQINSRWHPALTDSDALDIAANIRFAHVLSRGGIDWSAWSAVTRERCGV